MLMRRIDRDEDDNLLGHAVGGPAYGEDEECDGDHQLLLALETEDGFTDGAVDGPRGLDDGEGAAADEDEEDYLGGFLHPLGDRFEHLEDAHRGPIDMMIGQCIDEGPPGPFVLEPVIDPCGKYVGHYRREDDDGDQYDVGMRDLDSLFLLTSCLHRHLGTSLREKIKSSGKIPDHMPLLLLFPSFTSRSGCPVPRSFPGPVDFCHCH